MTPAIFGAIDVPSDYEIVRMILLHEGIDGEYTDDPDDAGGPTRFGITIPVLALHRGVPASSLTAHDIQNLSREEAESIYIARFIHPFVEIADPLRANVIDMGVNAGQRRATILLQQCIGAGVDGIVGNETRILSHRREWNDLYVGSWLAYYERLIENSRSQIKWRRGWRNRALSFDSRKATPRTLFTSTQIHERVGKAYLEEAA